MSDKNFEATALVDELIDYVIEYVESGYDPETRQNFMEVRDDLLRYLNRDDK